MNIKLVKELLNNKNNERENTSNYRNVPSIRNDSTCRNCNSITDIQRFILSNLPNTNIYESIRNTKGSNN